MNNKNDTSSKVSQNKIIRSYEIKNDYNYLLETIIRNKKKSILISAFLFVISSFYIFSKKQTWDGQFQIVLSEPETNNIGITSLLSNEQSQLLDRLRGGSKKSLSTEITILSSPSVLKPVFDYVQL